MHKSKYVFVCKQTHVKNDPSSWIGQSRHILGVYSFISLTVPSYLVFTCEIKSSLLSTVEMKPIATNLNCCKCLAEWAWTSKRGELVENRAVDLLLPLTRWGTKKRKVLFRNYCILNTLCCVIHWVYIWYKPDEFLIIGARMDSWLSAAFCVRGPEFNSQWLKVLIQNLHNHAH